MAEKPLDQSSVPKHVTFWRIKGTAGNRQPPAQSNDETLLVSQQRLEKGEQIETNGRQMPKDDRPEVRALYSFVEAAGILGFNPEILHCQTNAKLGMMEVTTPSHRAEVASGNLVFLASNRDGSDTRHAPDEANSWYQSAIPWSEEVATRETLAILKRLGKRQVAEQLAESPCQYEAEPMRVRMPDGTMTVVVPFVKIRFNDGKFVLHAEYRMRTNGSANLTRWFYRGP